MVCILVATQGLSSVHKAALFVLRWHFILDVAYQRHSDFCHIIPSQDVRDEMSFDLHLHLQHSAVCKMPNQEIGLPFLVPLSELHIRCWRTIAHLARVHHLAIRQSLLVDSRQEVTRIVCCHWSN